MDAISYSYADKQAKRISKFNENPDSTSGILTQPSVIQTGEIVSIPAGRTAVMANTVIDGTVILDGTMFIPSGATTNDIDAQLALKSSTIYVDNQLALKANIVYVDNQVAGSVPSGTIITIAKNTAPTGYLKANGALVSRTTYASLFAAINTTFGVGDGSTTFALPDLRGYFPRGWDDARGIDTGRAFGSTQADAYTNHSHTGSTDSQGSHSHAYNYYGGSYTAAAGNSAISNIGAIHGTANVNNNIAAAGAHTHNVTVNASTTGGTETRPKNIALLYCIKY